MTLHESKTSTFTWIMFGITLGPGVGFTLGLAIWGADGIPFGLIFGTGIGITLGAILDTVDRRRSRDPDEDPLQR